MTLRRSEQLFETIIQNITEPVLLINKDFKILWANKAFQEQTGYKLEEIIGNHCHRLTHHSEIPCALPYHLCPVAEAQKTGKATNVTHTHFDKKGNELFVEIMVYPVKDEEEEIIQFIYIYRDITERKRAEEEIKKLNRELKQRITELTGANKELDAFNYSVSHDLQSPLVAIGGFAQRLLKISGAKLDANEKDMINIIKMKTQKMESLIQDLLAFSRSGRQQIKATEIDMVNLVIGVIDESKVLTEGRKIQFDVKSLSPAYGDKVLVKQVMINLLSNAIKFTRLKDMAIIEVGCIAEENKTIYYVKDNGIGFYSEQTEELFSPFYRPSEAKKFEGSGIGLSIVQRVIDKHGGQVWAEGQVNEGAVFYFSLPNKV